jgi:hypothetical protein
MILRQPTKEKRASSFRKNLQRLQWRVLGGEIALPNSEAAINRSAVRTAAPSSRFLAPNFLTNENSLASTFRSKWRKEDSLMLFAEKLRVFP